MPITIRDIARQTNLSHTTVSRVLNGSSTIRIPDETRARVRQAANDLGYRPNLNARALVTGRTNRVMLQLSRLDSPFCSLVAQQLQSLASHDGYETLVHEFDGPGVGLRSVVDGVIVLDRLHLPVLDGDDDATPQVSIGAFHAGVGDVVEVNLYSASEQVMQLFRETGRRRVVYLGRAENAGIEDKRFQAFRTAHDVATHSIPVPENTRAHGRHSLTEYIARFGCPDAVFCENDELAVGAYRAVKDSGRRVPEDVALVGCDGIDEIEYFDPPLTTIAQPIALMCQAGWEFLENRIADPKREPQRLTLSAEIRFGRSH